MKLADVVWSAVAAVSLSVLSVVFAVFGDPEVSVSLTGAAITSAILASRER